MKQRNRKLAFLCITAALLAAGPKPAKADETKDTEKKEENYTLHTGAAKSVILTAEKEVEKLKLAAAQGELLPIEETPEAAVAQVDSYINVRNLPSLEGEIIGKLYNDSVGKIIGEEGEWLKIVSGSVEGYIKAEYAIRGEDAAAKAQEVGERFAKVSAVTLRLREAATTESETLGLLPKEEVLKVEEEAEGWVKVTAEETQGYVFAEHVELYTEYPQAESREEEERRLAEEAARAEAERQAAEAAAQAEAKAEARVSVSAPSSGGSTNREQPKPQQAEKENSPKPAASSLGRQIADYALQFVGNPYVYGGTSLTNGADCSGFVMSVYAHFGISLPRTSGEQGQCGVNVGGLSNAVPGDLVSYSGHIGIYIGNGQIVHASSARTGIKVSNASYRPILSVRRIV